MAKLITMAVALAIGAVLFWTLERLWPSVRDQGRLRSGRRTDVAYYFLNGVRRARREGARRHLAPATLPAPPRPDARRKNAGVVLSSDQPFPDEHAKRVA